MGPPFQPWDRLYRPPYEPRPLLKPGRVALRNLGARKQEKNRVCVSGGCGMQRFCFFGGVKRSAVGKVDV